MATGAVGRLIAQLVARACGPTRIRNDGGGHPSYPEGHRLAAIARRACRWPGWDRGGLPVVPDEPVVEGAAALVAHEAEQA